MAEHLAGAIVEELHRPRFEARRFGRPCGWKEPQQDDDNRRDRGDKLLATSEGHVMVIGRPADA
jgi:hypothetical protein